MGNFRDNVKVLTDEQKEKIFSKLLTEYMNIGLIGRKPTKQEIFKKIQKDYESSLSQDEILAIASISSELISFCAVQGYYYARIPERKKLIETLYENHNIKTENVLKVVNSTVSDIVGARKYTTKEREYEINVVHILDIMDGKDPFRIHRKEAEAETARSKFKIVK